MWLMWVSQLASGHGRHFPCCHSLLRVFCICLVGAALFFHRRGLRNFPPPKWPICVGWGVKLYSLTPGLVNVIILLQIRNYISGFPPLYTAAGYLIEISDGMFGSCDLLGQPLAFTKIPLLSVPSGWQDHGSRSKVKGVYFLMRRCYFQPFYQIYLRYNRITHSHGSARAF